ncbi:MAG: DNA methyltransferase [Dehalococcoidia bacterium]
MVVAVEASSLRRLRPRNSRPAWRPHGDLLERTQEPAIFKRGNVEIWRGDTLRFYPVWKSPTVIISDGPYGVSGFPGDPPTAEHLPEIYEPHIEAWGRAALPSTTLWFWNTELGWATVHPTLVKHGWEYRSCHIWNKGSGHVAGNANTKTLRKFPVITEVCVQYVRVVTLPAPGAPGPLALREWLRHEWARTGLPFSRTNKACGVRNAATRKYFTKDHLWYFPPAEAFEQLVRYANRYGHRIGRPYFSIDGNRSVTAQKWDSLRAKFECRFGVHNVWNEPPVRNGERIKSGLRAVHLNQKPLSLIKLAIEASSDQGDVIWEPFGGMCTGAVAALQTQRSCFAAERVPEFFDLACNRLDTSDG